MEKHLSPDDKSLHSKLLSKHTMMQVMEAEQNMAIKPNCIYVITSTKLLTLKNGLLHLEKK